TRTECENANPQNGILWPLLTEGIAHPYWKVSQVMEMLSGIIPLEPHLPPPIQEVIKIAYGTSNQEIK
ncbi:MAG: hypothetical protein EZS28_010129, partial [Streblomastix strix]